jgi:hypothetical protein
MFISINYGSTETHNNSKLTSQGDVIDDTCSKVCSIEISLE